MKEYHILNLGAGVQSTTLYLLSMQGRIQKFDTAIFADTQDEAGAEERRLSLPDPPESVYLHLDWMATQAKYLDSQSPLVGNFHRRSAYWTHEAGPGSPILVRTRGQISADLLRGENSTGQRFASIPAYTSSKEGGDEGMIRRQCTKEYKVDVIERCIRREILGLAPRQHVPKGVIIHQYIGISWDERSRAFDVRRRFLDDSGNEKANWRVHFPLLTMNGEMKAGWTRDDCEAYLRITVPHKVYGSACILCPFKDDPAWAYSMRPGPTRERLITIDTGLRTPGTIVNRGLDQKLYLHRECRPIDQIDFTNERQLGFAMECEGGCGL